MNDYFRPVIQYTAMYNELADPPGFEPGPEAPEAPIISKLYYGSIEFIMGSFWKGKRFCPSMNRAILESPLERVGTE